MDLRISDCWRTAKLFGSILFTLYYAGRFITLYTLHATFSLDGAACEYYYRWINVKQKCVYIKCDVEQDEWMTQKPLITCPSS
jgi:hypothetical protein